LVKADSNGNKQWSQVIGGEGGDIGSYIKQIAPEQYIITGRTNSYGAGNVDIYTVKVSAEGTPIWEKTLGGDDEDESYCIQPTSDGGYIVVGSTNSYGSGNHDVYLIKLEPEIEPNNSPTADAGPDQTVTDTDGDGQEDVTLDGSGSDDPDGSIESYVWTEDGTQIATGVSPTVTLSIGNHTITLTVTDDDGATDTDDVAIKVQEAGNEPPTANAGPDQTFTDTDDNGSESVTLNGNGSDDPDGTIESYVWTEDGTQIATGVNPTVTLSVGTHTITLTVTDDDGATDTDDVAITVQEAGNEQPAANAGPDQTVTDTDGNGQEAVTLDGSSSDDPDGSIESYVWTEDGIQIATGVSPTVTLSVGTHTITLTVTDDDGATDTGEVEITIQQAENQTPIVRSADIDISGLPQTMYPDIFYTVTAKYYDPDGRTDLKNCYLRLNHPDKPLTMMWYQSDDHAVPWAGEEGEAYLTEVDADAKEVSNGDEGYEITWSFKINDSWPEVENAIDFGVFASDDGGLESGWDHDDKNASFIPEEIGTITGRVTDASTNEGIVGAALLLDPDPFPVCYITDENGNFSFLIPAGTYDVTASASGYSTLTKSVTVTTGETVEVNFTLQIPVIIIPGLMGSYLEHSGDMVWNPDAAKWKIWQHELQELDDPDWFLTSNDISHDYYSPLWEALDNWGFSDPVRLEYPFSTNQAWQTDRDLFLFCYDWRQDLVDAATNLKFAVQWILDHSGASQVNIIAHSMGGLVARTYINLSENYSDKVRKLILLGVPSHGSVASYIALHPDLGCVLPFWQPWPLENTDWGIPVCASALADAVKDLPGLYQLLPTPKSFRDLYSYVFVDNWSYTAPGELSNGAEGALNSWDATYVENPDSRLANEELVNLAKRRHENTLGESLRFDGELYLFVGTNLETPLYVAKVGQIIYTSPPHSSTPAISNTHWDIYFSNGDKRVLARSAATLDIESSDPKRVILTFPGADHSGKLIQSAATLEIIGQILENTYSGEFIRHLNGRTEVPSFPAPLYSKIRLCSPAELRVYNEDGELVAGTDDERVTVIEETSCFVLGETKIVVLPSTESYRIEVVGTDSGKFTLDLSTCEGETTTKRYAFVEVPVEEGSIGDVTFDPQASSVPTMEMDINGDGTIDQSIMSEPGNTSLGSNSTLSFYNGLVTLLFGEIISAGHTICESIDSLEGVDLSFHPITPFYWLSTSARFSGPISITMQYEEIDATEGTESELRLYRITGESTIEDITQQLDPTANTVTGQTDGFSYFVVGYPLGDFLAGKLLTHGPNPVPAEGCIFWLNLPDDAVDVTLKIFDIDGAELANIPVDPAADRYPTTGRWIPEDDQGRLLGTGLYLYILEIEHADGTTTYSQVQKMVIQR
jgi:pimeloyl-ACP methyl ester carboxylesterase